jgi:hypothetical protein
MDVDPNDLEVKLILNVYKFDFPFLRLLGVTIYHTAIEFKNREYAFGSIDTESTGIYAIPPMSYEEATYIESIVLGKTTVKQFKKLLRKIKSKFIGKEYNFLTNNCHKFTNELISNLCDKSLPNKYKQYYG